MKAKALCESNYKDNVLGEILSGQRGVQGRRFERYGWLEVRPKDPETWGPEMTVDDVKP